MAINPNLLSGVRLTTVVKSSAKPTINPIADRDFEGIPFIREAAKTDNAKEQLLAAWRKSPIMTIISMFVKGMDSKSIMSTVGFDSRSEQDRKDWLKALNKAKDFMRMKISAEVLTERIVVEEDGEAIEDWVSVIPDNFAQQYEDKHGDIVTVNCAEKVRKGLHKALWRADYGVVCSIARGVPFAFRRDKEGKPIPPKMWEVIDWDRSTCEKKAHYADMKFQTVFNGQKGYTGERLPPGLAKYAMEMAHSAEAAAAEAESED